MMLSIVTPDEIQLNQLAFEPFLFFQPSQLKQQSDQVKIITLEEQNKVQALLPFYHINDKLTSPFRAPFGALTGAEQVPQSSYEKMLEELIGYAETEKIASIKLTQWPQSYAPKQAASIHQALLAKGFTVAVEEVNQDLFVTEEAFTVRLHDSEKRRLQKSLRSGFRVETGSFNYIDEYHAIVQRNRTHKGHPLTIGAEDLKKVLTGSQHHVFFAVYDQNKMIAAATGVRISSSILYYYLPGSEPEYAAYSPMVLLLQAMYEYCQAEGITLFDLGISTAGGVMNEGLFRFKKHLGAGDSLKLSYSKTW